MLPVVLILGARRASVHTLGFRPFERKSLEIGCGLFVAAYLLIILIVIALSTLKTSFVSTNK